MTSPPPPPPTDPRLNQVSLPEFISFMAAELFYAPHMYLSLQKTPEEDVIFTFCFPYILNPEGIVGGQFYPDSNFSYYGGIRELFLWLYVLIYRFCSLHTSAA